MLSGFKVGNVACLTDDHRRSANDPLIKDIPDLSKIGFVAIGNTVRKDAAASARSRGGSIISLVKK